MRGPAHQARRALAAAAVVAAGGLTLVPSPAVARGWNYVTAWGHEGGGAGQFGSGREAQGGDRQFDDPAGIAIDRSGNLRVADPSNNRVEKFSPTGSYQGAFGRFGFARGYTDAWGRLDLPEGLAMGPGNAVVVGDNRNDRLEVFSSRGRASAVMGGRGAYPGEMVSPMGLAVRKGVIYVIDQGNYRIDRFSLRGRYRGSFGRFGKAGCGLVLPYGMTIDHGGTIDIADFGRQKVIEFTTRGRCVRTFGTPGTGPGKFTHPTGIGVDGSGNLLVADNYNDGPVRGGGGAGGCVHRFTPRGALIDSFGDGRLQSPTYLAAGHDGSVYVSDSRRVVKFAPTAGAGNEQPCGTSATNQGEPPPDQTPPTPTCPFPPGVTLPPEVTPPPGCE